MKRLKALLKAGFSEYSLCRLGVSNEKTAGEFMAELEEKITSHNMDELAKKTDLESLIFIEGAWSWA